MHIFNANTLHNCMQSKLRDLLTTIRSLVREMTMCCGSGEIVTYITFTMWRHWSGVCSKSFLSAIQTTRGGAIRGVWQEVGGGQDKGGRLVLKNGGKWEVRLVGVGL